MPLMNLKVPICNSGGRGKGRYENHFIQAVII